MILNVYRINFLNLNLFYIFFPKIFFIYFFFIFFSLILFGLLREPKGIDIGWTDGRMEGDFKGHVALVLIKICSVELSSHDFD